MSRPQSFGPAPACRICPASYVMARWHGFVERTWASPSTPGGRLPKRSGTIPSASRQLWMPPPWTVPSSSSKSVERRSLQCSSFLGCLFMAVPFVLPHQQRTDHRRRETRLDRDASTIADHDEAGGRRAHKRPDTDGRRFVVDGCRATESSVM